MTTITDNSSYSEIAEAANSILEDRWVGIVDSVVERLQREQEDTSQDTTTVDNSNGPEIASNATTEVIQTTSRFSSAIWFEKIQEQNVVLAGLGGIGSYVAFLLSRMKPAKITMYDFDTVEVVNMAGQLYGSRDIGLTKTHAMTLKLREYSSYYTVYSHDVPFGVGSTTSNIMICGFDNMAARKTFFNAWKQHVLGLPEEEHSKCLFIDGRLNAEEFQVLSITGDNDYAINKYESEWLFDDSDVEEAVCSYKQTTYMANMIGSVMTNVFVNFCANMCDPLAMRDVPFLTRYDGSTMFFKTE